MSRQQPEDLYRSDAYVRMHPSLFAEESAWKADCIAPLVDRYLSITKASSVCVLDVGGGAGLVLRDVCSHIGMRHIKVQKHALDLSPGMLEVQKQNNSDMVSCLNEDIRATSLGDKAVDLTLMVDVLEHVPNPEEALGEVRRISRFAILKVPLEDNLTCFLWNFVTRGRFRQYLTETYGHINSYSLFSLRSQITQHLGDIIVCQTGGTAKLGASQPRAPEVDRGRAARLKDIIQMCLLPISPTLSCLIVTGFTLLLVKCYEEPH